jgi:hypothetical protein
MIHEHYTWQMLRNPFYYTEAAEPIIGHVSGRSTDIRSIITGQQSALIITGTPQIGKTVLLRYLTSLPTDPWSWRQEGELNDLREQLKLDCLYFVQINLSALGTIQSARELLLPFIAACLHALHSLHPDLPLPDAQDLQGLRTLLYHLNQRNRDARYFVMLDAIERLVPPHIPVPELEHSEAETLQERGIALLNHSGAIRVLVDLLDEFTNFGVILAIESLPRPKVVDQFMHISADLARFTTLQLQSFTWKDTTNFLAQKPEDFDDSWAQQFHTLGGDVIFSHAEQAWIREQAGTHPYLLQQFCFQTFYFKQSYAHIHDRWTELSESHKKQLVETINVRVITFLSLLWKRLQEALEKASASTREKFFDFILSLKDHQASEEITTWEELNPELRYILCNEGITRYDPFLSVHYPGAILREYLLQKIDQSKQTAARNFWLTINQPGKQQERLLLSELEYGLMRVLLQHPSRCSEDELMKGAWGKVIGRPTFTQRMHHLRKKLREHSHNIDMIINHYGGEYSLNNSSWLRLEKPPGF